MRIKYFEKKVYSEQEACGQISWYCPDCSENVIKFRIDHDTYESIGYCEKCKKEFKLDDLVGDY